MTGNGGNYFPFPVDRGAGNKNGKWEMTGNGGNYFPGNVDRGAGSGWVKRVMRLPHISRLWQAPSFELFLTRRENRT